MPKETIRCVEVEHAESNPSIPFFAKPGGSEPHTKITFTFNVDYEDYLLLSGSTKEGYKLTITPLKQPLPEDDSEQWRLPE